MTGTRSSSRLAAQPSSSPVQAKTSSSTDSTNGNKRKADSSPSAEQPKKGRKTGEKEQKTLEETIQPNDKAEADNQPEDVEMTNSGSSTSAPAETDRDGKPSCWFWSDSETYPNGKAVEGKVVDDSKTMKAGDSFKGKNKEGESKADPEKSLKDSRGGPGLNALPVDKSAPKDVPRDDIHDQGDTKPTAKDESGSDTKQSAEGGAVEESKQRAEAQPSNILEKGIIYFFTRGRVGIEDPGNVTELQRSHFVLRPLSPGAKLTDGAIEDVKNNRLLALPKKVFPKGPQDKFMAFVEQGKTSMDGLKKSFFQGSEYTTKTTGVRQAPPVTPMAEGVYAITKAGDRDETHLAYMITIPRDPGEMQNDIGISSKGSFVLSLKNPTASGPSYASLPEKPEFPQEFIDEFSGRSWMPVQPKHLDYPNAQILLIGESFDDSHALDATSKDEKSNDTETPKEELEKLEGEDELRVEHLKGDDTIFEDLGISHKEYPSVPTTW